MVGLSNGRSKQSRARRKSNSLSFPVSRPAQGRSSSRLDDGFEALNRAGVKLRDARFADTKLGAEVLELHAAEVVLRDDVALALGQLLDRLGQGLLRELGG